MGVGGNGLDFLSLASIFSFSNDLFTLTLSASLLSEISVCTTACCVNKL